ncbi:MAG: DNA topoisomerase IV subunit A [Elusimicrobia bacterium]|nr:DNA topoisomerase IV subunit A [Candidatus Obscuribacterium magneticum]
MPTPKLIEQSAKRVYDDILKKDAPSLDFPLRSLDNVSYDKKAGYFEIGDRIKVRSLDMNTIKSFAQTIRMMALSHDITKKDDIATKREAYYVSKNWGEARFNEQVESDAIMDDIEAHFRLNREQLGFIPEEKGGEVAGKLVVIDKEPDTKKDLRIDCTRFGSGAYSIPISCEELRFETDAKFILAIETVGMFQRLVKHNYWKTANCVLVSMGGVPTRACRRFIRRLADIKKLPVYAFVDGDPYGITNIYRTLKVGSGNNAHLNKYFCVPQASYLGVTPQDIIDYKLKDATHPLVEVDIKRAKDALKNDPFIKYHKEWKAAIEQMLAMGVRVEQQAFAKHDLNYVIDKYLPEKLRKPKLFLP